MANSLHKKIEQHFAATLAAEGGFTRHEEKSPYIARSDVAFTRPMRSGGRCLVIAILFDHRGRSRFSVEIGWSSDRLFPRLPIRPSGEASVRRKEFKEPNFLARLSSLWGKPDAWWEVGNEAEVPRVIADVMRRLEEFGFPYLAEKEQEVSGES